MAPGTGPLDGLLVVALEQAVAAPYCSSRLADAGARVIKIEREGGDFARHYDSVVHGESAYFVWLNRGKESLVLDIKNADDTALLHRIVDKADIFIQNLAPGAATRAGFGSDALRARNPSLICCDISGYGEEGAYAEMKAYDLLVQAETGLCSITGGPEAPARVGVSVCDVGCGMYAYAAVLEAVIERGRTGEGKTVAVSLFDGMADWMTVPLLFFDYGGKAPERLGLRHPTIHPYGAYPTRGGAQILIAIQNEREFRNLCESVLERADIPADPRFSNNTVRCANSAALDEIIVSVFASLERDVLIGRLRDAGVAYGEVNDVAGLSHHPVLRRSTVDTPTGPVDLVAPPARFDGQSRPFGPIPAVGQHSEALRREFGE